MVTVNDGMSALNEIKTCIVNTQLLSIIHNVNIFILQGFCKAF